MQYRKIPKTDIEVSVVCMGCWALAGGRLWGAQDEADALAAIRTSLDLGVNFFDTAEGYGSGGSEEMLAKGLGDRRSEVVIATKVSPNHLTSEADLREACERSLKHLHTDVIDLYQVHWPNWNVPIAETLATMEKLKDEGRIRCYGVSNFGPRDLAEATAHGSVSVDQVAYNLLWRGVEFELQEICDREQVGILCYSPMMQGLLTGKFATAEDVPDERARCRLFSSERETSRHGGPGHEAELFEVIAEVRRVADEAGVPMGHASLAWLIAQPAVTAAIAGSRNAEQAKRNAAAGDAPLAQQVAEALSDATLKLKKAVGPRLDLWQTEGRIR